MKFGVKKHPNADKNKNNKGVIRPESPKNAKQFIAID
jgi:hypothetical protein